MKRLDQLLIVTSVITDGIRQIDAGEGSSPNVLFVVADPHESKNLAERAQYADVVQDLRPLRRQSPISKP